MDFWSYEALSWMLLGGLLAVAVSVVVMARFISKELSEEVCHSRFMRQTISRRVSKLQEDLHVARKNLSDRVFDLERKEEKQQGDSVDWQLVASLLADAQKEIEKRDG